MSMSSRAIVQRTVVRQDTEPADTDVLWRDSSNTPDTLKIYNSDSETWDSVSVTDHGSLSNVQPSQHHAPTSIEYIDVTGSRSFSTWYLNSRDGPIQVVWRGTGDGSQERDMQLHVSPDQTDNVVNAISEADSNQNPQFHSIDGLVPEGQYYKVTSNNVSTDSVNEVLFKS